MTKPADDTAVEDAFEAYLAGRPVPVETADTFAGVAVFAEAVRATATRPGRPNAALAELLATGLLTDQSSPSARTATSAGAPPSRGASRIRNRRRFAMIFPVLLAKLLSAGALAQAATGAGLVLVVATGAGATGVLGDDVQETVTSVVDITAEETTEDDLGAGEDETTTDTGTGIEPTPVVETPAPAEPVEGEFDAAASAANGPAEDETFGEWVSKLAHDREWRDELRAEGRNFGEVVRTWASKKGLDDRELAAEGVDVGELTDDVAAEPAPAPEVTAESPDAEPDVATTQRNENGNGNGNGGGKAPAAENGDGKGKGENGGGKGNGRD
jgi:hypothetical protein